MKKAGHTFQTPIISDGKVTRPLYCANITNIIIIIITIIITIILLLLLS